MAFHLIASIDWESFEHHTAFITSEEHVSFVADSGQLFDIKDSPPVTRKFSFQLCRSYKAKVISVYTHVANCEAATAAFRSSVTEVAFYTMPTRPDEATRAAIEAGSETVLREVQVIGKATGAAIGWGKLSRHLLDIRDLTGVVFDAVPQALASGPQSVSLYGVFGYKSVEDHMTWRETPEAIRHGKPSKTILPATIVPGIDQSLGYFHVKFHEET